VNFGPAQSADLIGALARQNQQFHNRAEITIGAALPNYFKFGVR
jgi:hypothetical protein